MKILSPQEFAEKFNDMDVFLHFKNNTLYLTADQVHFMEVSQIFKESVSNLLSKSISNSSLVVD